MKTLPHHLDDALDRDMERSFRMAQALAPALDQIAQAARLNEIRRVRNEAEIVSEACRLTDEWANGFYLGRGTEPTPGEYARVGIGYYLELKGIGGYSTPGDIVGKCGICGGLLVKDQKATACESCGREVTR